MNKTKLTLCLSALLMSATAQAEVIKLSNGDILDAEIVKQTPETLTVSHPVLGDQQIVKENITNLVDLNLSLVPGEETDEGLFGLGILKGWANSFDLGVTGADGPTDNFNFRAAFSTRYEDEEDRWDFSSYYVTNSADDKTISNKANATLLKDWFFQDSPWFAFAGLTYDFDKFKDWDHRLQVTAGPGYQFVKNDVWELSGRIGGTGLFEFGRNNRLTDVMTTSVTDPTGVTTTTETPATFGSAHNRGHFEVMAGADFLWNISKSQLLSVSNYIYTRVTDGGKIRNVTTVDWKHDLEFFKGLAIKFNIRNEYDRSQSVDRNKNDLQYGVSLGLLF